MPENDVKLYAILGEPGLMPRQAAGIAALRSNLITRVGGVGARGFDAVGLEIPGVIRVAISSGQEQFTAPIPPGNACTVTCLPHATIDDNGQEYDWERIYNRIYGVSYDPATAVAPRPNPLDCQTLTIVAHRLSTGVFWPRWSGFAYECERVASSRGGTTDAFVVRGFEYAYWINQATLDPRWLAATDREFGPASAEQRIHTVLDRIGYVVSRGDPQYSLDAPVSSRSWDFILPRRTRRLQGIGAAEGNLPGFDTDGGEARISAQAVIAATALRAKAQLVMHHGPGPIDGTDVTFDTRGNNPTLPDRRAVNAQGDIPAATVQIDWGGMLTYLPWETVDGLYTTGGMATPITLTVDQTSARWSASVQRIAHKPNTEHTANTARWSGLDEDGNPTSPPTTYYYNTEERAETLNWVRKFGLKEHSVTGQPYSPEDGAALTADAAVFLRGAPIPKPVVEFSLADTGEPGYLDVICALGVGHLFQFADTWGQTTTMVVTRLAQDFRPNGITTTVTAVPHRIEIDDSGRVLPRAPRAKQLVAEAGATPADTDQAPYTPEPPDNLPGPRNLFAAVPPVRREPRGARIYYPSRDQVLVVWDWPVTVGSVPISGWRVEVDDTTRSFTGRRRWGKDIDHPWQTWALFGSADTDLLTGPQDSRRGSPSYATAGLLAGIESRGCRATVQAKSRLYDRDTIYSASLEAVDPPGAPRNVQIVRAPDSGVWLLWEPPLDQGGAELAYYSISGADGTAIAGAGRISASYPVRKITAAQLGTRTRLYLTAHNYGTPPGDAQTVEVEVPPNTTPDTVATALPAIPGPNWAKFGYVDARAAIVFSRIARGTTPVADNRIALQFRLTDLDDSTKTIVRFNNGQRSGVNYPLGFVPEFPQLQADGTRIDPSGPSYRLEARCSIGTGRNVFVANAEDDASWSPWIEQGTIPGRAFGATAVRDLDLVRTSSTREASDGLLIAMRAPRRPSEWPAARIDETAAIKYLSTPVVIPDDWTYPDTATSSRTADRSWGSYDYVLDGANPVSVGWGNRDIHLDTADRTTRVVTVTPRQVDQRGDTASAHLPALPTPAAPELMAGRESPTSTTARVFVMPTWAGDDGQASQFRVRQTGAAWGTATDFNSATPASRPTLPGVTIGTGEATIEAQVRVEGGPWSPSNSYTIPAVYDPGTSDTSVVLNTLGPVNVRVGWWDAYLRDAGGGAGSENQIIPDPAEDDRDNWGAMVLMWDEGPYSSRQGSRLRASSYLIRIETDPRNRLASELHPTTGNYVYAALQTNSDKLFAVIPVNNAFRFNMFRSWQSPGRFGEPVHWAPGFNVLIFAQRQAGMNAVRNPTTGQLIDAYRGYHAAPRFAERLPVSWSPTRLDLG